MNDGLFLYTGKFEGIHGKLRGFSFPLKIVIETLLFRCHLVELALAFLYHRSRRISAYCGN